MKCFYLTLSSDRKMKEISTPISIACGGGCCDKSSRPLHRCNAIWDTGATSSMISAEVARKLKLHRTGEVQISGVHGMKQTSTYMVDLLFTNGFSIDGLNVSEADDGGGFDVLIGMDVIGRGRLLVDGLGDGCYIAFAFPADN